MGSMLTMQFGAGASATMSSRDIAEMTGKRHDNVLRVCYDLKASGVTPQIEECRVINELANGREFTEFRLNKRDSHILVARLSPEFTGRLVDRWMELEAAEPAPALPKTFADALRLAADQQDIITAQAAQLEAAAPALEFVGRYVESTGLMTFRQVAKLLQVKEPEFRRFLHAAKIMYPLNGEWTAHAQHIEAGRFEMRAGTAQGNGHAFNTAKFTAKGVEWVAGELAKWQLKQRSGEADHG